MRLISAATLLSLALAIGGATATYAEENPTVVKLVMRDRVVHVTSTPDQVVYSVQTRDGKVLDANLSGEELQAKHPEVYNTLRPAIANGKDTHLQMSPWAGVNFPGDK